MNKILKQFSGLRTLILEIPLFFISIELLDRYLQRFDLSLSAWRPDLYWIGIVGFGFMYGLRFGGLVGGTAALIQIPWAELKELYGMDFTISLAHPFLMLAGGIVAGMLSSRDKNALFEFRQKAIQLATKIDHIEEDRQRLINANLELEKKAVSREDTVLTLYSAAQKLSSLEVEKIYENVPELLIRYLNARSCSVYLFDKNQLQLIAQQNWTSSEQHPQKYDRNHPLYRLLQQKGRVLYPTDLKGVDDSVLIAPLMTPDKRLFGMFKIEDMAFVDLNPNAVQLIQILGEWVMQAVENAKTYGASAQTQIQDEITGAHSFAYFQSRLGREIHLTKRYHLDLSVLFIRIKGYSKMSSDVKKTVLSMVYRVLEFQIRSDDLIARMREEDSDQFAVILPFTGAKVAQIAMKRCLADIEEFGFKPFKNKKIPLVLTWEAFETKDQSLYTHPIVVEYVSEKPDHRIDQMVERLLN
ncbi:MAG: GAF domain-containing protein [SAR324 cluster bacterium]|nr:GAF domain-containing protein [SAR324 cluster bacterium]